MTLYWGFGIGIVVFFMGLGSRYILNVIASDGSEHLDNGEEF